jgi:hypothetical protein
VLEVLIPGYRTLKYILRSRSLAFKNLVIMRGRVAELPSSEYPRKVRLLRVCNKKLERYRHPLNAADKQQNQVMGASSMSWYSLVLMKAFSTQVYARG